MSHIASWTVLNSTRDGPRHHASKRRVRKTSCSGAETTTTTTTTTTTERTKRTERKEEGEESRGRSKRRKQDSGKNTTQGGEGDGDNEHDRDGGRRPLPPRTARRTPCPARRQRGRDERGERKDEKTREREKGKGRQGESGGGERNGRTKREEKNNREVEVVRFQRPSALLGCWQQKLLVSLTKKKMYLPAASSLKPDREAR